MLSASAEPTPRADARPLRFARLLDYKTQESYDNKIVERYMSFCADSGGGLELERQFASLSLHAGGVAAEDDTVTSASRQAIAMTAAPAAVPATARSADKTLLTLILAMRKLREGIVASNRVDDFTTRAYIFCIRASILM